MDKEIPRGYKSGVQDASSLVWTEILGHQALHSLLTACRLTSLGSQLSLEVGPRQHWLEKPIAPASQAFGHQHCPQRAMPSIVGRFRLLEESAWFPYCDAHMDRRSYGSTRIVLSKGTPNIFNGLTKYRMGRGGTPKQQLA